MSGTRPILWKQGLFLGPQHFQLIDQHHESLLYPLRKFMTPYFWGVASIDISKSALGLGNLRLTGGEFLFPDGSYVTYPGNGVVEGRNIEDAWQDRDKPFPVYIAVRKQSERGGNVSVQPNLHDLTGVVSRFVTKEGSEEAFDLHQGGPSCQVQYLDYVLKFIWEAEKDQMGDYSLLLIGQLVIDGGEIRFDSRCLPPAISLNASDELFNVVKEIRDEIASRSRRLEEYKQQRGIHNAEFGSRDMVFLLALRTLNRYASLLFHYTKTPSVHPWMIYSSLIQLIGELTTFSEEISAFGETAEGDAFLPDYDHQNLGECFFAAQALIIRLLDEVTSGPEYIISLLFDGSYFCADLPPSIFEGNKRFYLVVNSHEDPKIIIDSLTGIAKVSARESMPLLIARALSGLKIEHMPSPPPELPRRSDSVYFQIDHHSDFWGNVQQSKNIALYWDNAPEDFTVEFMVVERS